jgi:SAM-dependent methyltransferase
MSVAKTEWWKNFFSGLALDMWRQAVTEEQTRAEADFIEKRLQLPAQSKILDVPCGNGRLAIELAGRGYQTTGVDIALGFIEEARAKAAQRSLPTTWENREMRDLPWSEVFDGAFCFGNSFGYLDDEGNADFLKAVARALKSGAPFLIDTGIAAESILPNLREQVWMEIGDILFLASRRYNHVEGRLDIEYRFMRDGKVEKKPASQRIYTYRELCRLLAAAGFTDYEGYSSLSREPFKLGSHRLLMVAKRL